MFGLMRARASGNRLTARDAVDRHTKGELTVVDVRDISELRGSGTAAGSVHVPLMLLAAKADPRHPEHDKALHPEKPVALFCASGARSEMAAGMLRKLGYKEVHNIGGFGDWCAAGGKVRR